MSRMKNEDKKPYPLNLLTDIVGDDAVIYEIATDEDKMNGLEYAIGMLPERMIVIVNQFYKNDVKCADIANDFGVTPNRIYELKRKAMRMLRHHTRYTYIMHGIEGTKLRLAEEEAEHQRKFDEEREHFLEFSFKEMEEFLNIRAYNCLCRHCAFGKELTIGDLDEMSDEELMKAVRNLGKNTLYNIREAIMKVKAKYRGEPLDMDYYTNEITNMDILIEMCLERLHNKNAPETKLFASAVRKRYAELKAEMKGE